jgi:thiol:disulfide interchange protein DsbA
MFKYILSTMLFCVPLMSFGADFVAGKDYEILKQVAQVEHVSSHTSVTEFFSFGCPWCYRLEPALNQWVEQHKNTVNFQKVPVIFNKDWEYYAKAYYAAQALSLSSTMNSALFKAILQDKHVLNSDKAMIDFFIQQGVDSTTAKSAFGYSTSIEMSVKAGQELMGRYQINAVPAVVVNNQFKTDLQMAKTEERMLAILDFLVAQSKLQKI